MRIRLYWLVVFLIITAGAFMAYQQYQAPLSYRFAEQFDGNDYEGIYDFFNGNSSQYHVSAPFHSRIFVPYLASLVGSERIIEDFTTINLIFVLLSVAMLFLLWRDLGFDLKWFVFGLFWLLFHWTGIVRLNIFDPITVDVPLYLFQALFLWLILKRRFMWLLLLGPVATAQKESFIALLFVLTIYGWYHNRKQQDGYYELKWIISAFMLSLLTKWVLNFYFPPIEAGRGAIITILFHMRELVYHPFQLVRWMAAFFMAFGPMLIAATLALGRKRHYDNRRNLLVLFSLVYAFFGIFAGGDMTRIIYLGFPFIMTLIAFALKELETKLFWTLALLSVPLMFLTKNIPDPAFEWESWTSWYPEFAPLQFVLIYTGYALVSIAIIWSIRKRIWQ